MKTNGKPLRVVLADDHAVVRAGLRLLLEREPGVVVLAEAATAQAAVDYATELRPDIVLMDVTMPGESGIDAIPRLFAAAPGTKVVVLSMHDDPMYVHGAFAAGASGYVLKDAADTELVAAIRDVAGGETYVNPTLGARLIAAETKEQAAADADPLSKREHEVLRLLALGHTNQEIAEQLFISVRTAETHRAHIMRKLVLASRAELVRYALTHRLLTADA
ncbi:MAG TPA: response regulator transcription factor [Gaiellaceae bacterium]|jgi:two-component system response regulator NreC|nr:response regulator transcription factor [Gaiellaceae bacterium]